MCWYFYSKLRELSSHRQCPKDSVHILLWNEYWYQLMEIKSSLFEAWLILDLQMVHICRSEAAFPVLGWRLEGKTSIRGCSVGEQRRGQKWVQAEGRSWFGPDKGFGYTDKNGIRCLLHSWASVSTWTSDWMRLRLEETGPSLGRFYFLWVILRRTAI